jgi:glutamyl-tRNA reductase
MTPTNWHLALCGINHKTSSLESREPLQIGHHEIARANALFAELPGIQESLIISTCNRVEFYFVAKKSEDAFEFVRSFYDKLKNIDILAYKDIFYCRKNNHVVNHLFNVAAGIDSMVIGENQILGQLKEAYSSACAVKAAGKIIHRLFHQAFRVGKLVRSETEMGKGACSVSSATVEFLKAKMEKIGNPSILFIGINQMIALAASNIARFEHKKLMFANRTEGKAVEFAAKYNATGHALAEIPSLLKTADIVITCTSADMPIISKETIDDYLSANPDRDLTVMDMAVPRDVEINKSYHPNILVYDLEDIKSFISVQQRNRELAIPQAQEIIERKLSEFKYWFDHVQHEPVYNGLAEAYEEVRRQELSGILKILPPETHKDIEAATKNMVKKILQLKYGNA